MPFSEDDKTCTLSSNQAAVECSFRRHSGIAVFVTSKKVINDEAQAWTHVLSALLGRSTTSGSDRLLRTASPGADVDLACDMDDGVFH
jgi:hypothetical protein